MALKKYEDYDDTSGSEHNVWTSSQPKEGEGHCVWYGTCEGDECDGHNYNIAYNGTAKPIDPADVEDLKSVCPELFFDLGM